MADIMQRAIRIAMLSTVFMGLLATAADEPAARDLYRYRAPLVGLWEGIDALDGSTIAISIGDLDGDGVLNFWWYESFFTGCFTPENQRGRAVLNGTVQWKSASVVTLVSSEYFCLDDLNNRSDRSPIALEFSYAWRNDLLVRDGNEAFPGFILHRTSAGERRR